MGNFLLMDMGTGTRFTLLLSWLAASASCSSNLQHTAKRRMATEEQIIRQPQDHSLRAIVPFWYRAVQDDDVSLDIELDVLEPNVYAADFS